MTERHPILIKMPTEKFERMTRTMRKERISNKTAFILNAIDTVCSEQEKVTATENLEEALSIVVENARIDRENAAKRHTEVMIWLETLAEAVLGGEEENISKFKSVIKIKLQQRRGTT